MHGEDGIVDHDGERQKVEEIGEEAPDFGRAILASAFLLKAVGLRFSMVASARLPA